MSAFRRLALALAVLLAPAVASAQTLIQPPASASSVTATGSTTARALAARFAERVNVKDFGATGNGTADDSAAFIAAINRANTLALAGAPIDVYMPAGIYRVVSTLPEFSRNGGIIGDGPNKTWVKLDTAYSGDVFVWSEAWAASSYPPQGPAGNPASQTAGPFAADFSVLGTTASAAQQNVFNFYDRTDFVLMRDINIFSINGRALYAGARLHNLTDTAYQRESIYSNLRIFTAGAVGVPAVEFTSSGTVGDTTNEITFYHFELFAPLGPGVKFHSPAANKTMRNIRAFGFRVEGVTSPSPSLAGDLLQIGDSADAGLAAYFDFYGLELTVPYAGYCALRTAGASAALQPFDLVFSGAINNGPGKGVCVDAGRSLRFRLSNLATTDTQVTVASSTTVGSNVEFDGNGAETGWTYSIDPTAVQSIRRPLPSYGNPTATSIIGGSGGNARGTNAVDFQTDRSTATQVASGDAATVLGGRNNTASGAGSTAMGGTSNVASGDTSLAAGNGSTASNLNSLAIGFANTVSGSSAVGLGQQHTISGPSSSAPGGSQASDRGSRGTLAWSAGRLAVTGDAQTRIHMLRGTTASASAIRLTADQLTAGSNNTINIPNNTVYSVRITVVAINHSSTGNNEVWSEWLGILSRGASAGSTLLAMGTKPTALTNGTVAGSDIAATADTTNGAVNITFTPPTANANTWNAVARIDTVEVQ